MPDDQILRSDQEKMSFILQSIGIRDDIISKDDLQNRQFNRIGKKVDDRSRMLKINLHDNTIREAIMKNAPTLKTLHLPFKSTYINRHSHLVYLKENPTPSLQVDIYK